VPEITSVDAIRAKLREFGERVEGAITAADSIVGARSDADKLLKQLKSDCTKGKKYLGDLEKTRLALQQLQGDWNELKKQIEDSQAESERSWDLLLSDMESALQTLGKKLAEAEARIRGASEAVIAEQAELLKRLAAETARNADRAEQARAKAVERAEKLEQLLASVRDELRSEIRNTLLNTEKALGEKFQAVANGLKEEMAHELTEHRQGVDRRLTDFLNKQNALVQNLTQQIDGFQRAFQSLTDQFKQTKAEVDAVTKELESSKPERSQIRAHLKVLKLDLDAEGVARGRLGAALDAITARLDETRKTLKQVPLVGKWLKNW
jgi:chromosome segregation ATPase